MSFLSKKELSKYQFSKIGNNVLISSKASIYNAPNIHLGDNVRIDDFSIISAGKGGIFIGRNVHIACYVSLIGEAKIQIGNFSGISARTNIFSSNDDYSGNYLTGPTIPYKFRNVKNASVIIGSHVIVGGGSIILPGINIENGVAIGAMSLINANCKSFGIYLGIPAKWVKKRSKNILKLEKEFLNFYNEK